MSLVRKALEKYAQHDFTPDDNELRDIVDDDWEEISNDPAQLKVLRYTIKEAKQIRAGVVPDAYIAITDCRRCGSVYVWPGYPDPASSCPWCFNRVKGLPVPNAGA